jgi:hypothetical protein
MESDKILQALFVLALAARATAPIASRPLDVFLAFESGDKFPIA